MQTEVFGVEITENKMYADVLICVYGDSGERKQNIDLTIDNPGPAQ